MESTTLDMIYNGTTLEANISDTDWSNNGANNTFNSSLMEIGWKSPTWFKYTMSSVDFVLFTFGMFGNFSIVMVVMRSFGRLRPYNLLVVILAISDMLALLTNSMYQLTLLQIVTVDATVGTKIGCLIFLSTRQTLACLTLSIIVLICIERFVVVVFPLKVNFVSLRKTLILLSICVVLDLTAGVFPAALFSQVNGGRCRINVNSNPSIPYPPLRAMLYTVVIIIPLITVLSLTPVIIYKLNQIRAIRSRLTNQERRIGIFQTSVMLMSVVVAYIILVGIPFTCYLALNLEGYEIDTEASTVARVCTLVIFQTNHSTNFIIYGISSEKFRKKLLSQFGCSCKNGRKLDHSTPQINNNGSDGMQLPTMTNGSSL